MDKFKAFGLTQLPASLVAAPLIGQCDANLECRVSDKRAVNRYGLFVLEVLKAWIDPARKDPRTLHHRGRGAFMVAGPTIRLPSKMRQPPARRGGRLSSCAARRCPAGRPGR